jgi:hypothetical protein
MRAVICWLLLTVASHAAQFLVYYYLPDGNSGRQVIEIEASDSEAARRIFQAMMPRARISNVKRVPPAGEENGGSSTVPVIKYE